MRNDNTDLRPPSIGLSRLSSQAQERPRRCRARRRPQERPCTSCRLRTARTVTSPFTVRFGLRGMGVAPAGVTNPNTGHHHSWSTSTRAAGEPADAERANIGTSASAKRKRSSRCRPASTRCSSCSATPCTSRISRPCARRRSRSPSRRSSRPMDIRTDFVDAVGNTPLIKLRKRRSSRAARSWAKRSS